MIISLAYYLFHTVLLRAASCCCFCRPPIIRVGYDYSGDDIVQNPQEQYSQVQDNWLAPWSILMLPDNPPQFEEFMEKHLDEFIDTIQDNPDEYLNNDFCSLIISEAEGVPEGLLQEFEDKGEIQIEIKHFKKILRQIFESSNRTITRLRDDLWNLLFKSKDRPLGDAIKSFYLQSLVPIRNIFPDNIRTVFLKSLIVYYMTRFLVPSTFAWHFECNPDTSAPIRNVSLRSYALKPLKHYVESLSDLHRRIQKSLECGERVRNPYGHGSNIVIDMIMYHRHCYEYASVQRLFAKSFLEPDLLQIELEIIRNTRDCREKASIFYFSMGNRIRILIRKNDGSLQLVSELNIPWKSAGEFKYPSVLLLKQEIETRLQDEGILPNSPRFYPAERLVPKERPHNGSMLLMLLPKDILTLIMNMVGASQIKTDILLVCTAFYHNTLPMYHNPVYRAKEMTLFMSICKSRIPEFLYASVISIGRQNLDKEKRRNAIATLALFLYHRFLFIVILVDLLADLAAGGQFPDHLQPWRPFVDFSIFLTMRRIVFAI